jgi:hypothetical protein
MSVKSKTFLSNESLMNIGENEQGVSPLSQNMATTVPEKDYYRPSPVPSTPLRESVSGLVKQCLAPQFRVFPGLQEAVAECLYDWMNECFHGEAA